jgi:hypothetical protein
VAPDERGRTEDEHNHAPALNFPYPQAGASAKCCGPREGDFPNARGLDREFADAVPDAGKTCLDRRLAAAFIYGESPGWACATFGKTLP